MNPENNKWNNSAEQIDEAAEAKRKEEFMGLQPEALPGFVCNKIKEKIEEKLDNKYMKVAGAEFELYFELGGAPTVPVRIKFDARKEDFMSALQDELNQQIQDKKLQGSQNITKFSFDIKTYEMESKEGKEEKVNYGGGYENLL